MSKRICFSSVLRQKRGPQNVLNKMPVQQQSLQQIMQEFAMNPSRDFTLRYCQSSTLKGCSSRQGFQEGFNQLDHWIQNQIQYNKQNISDTQPRRQIPNQLLKFANAGSKSPRKLNQAKGEPSGFSQPQNLNQPQGHRNVDMKEICRQYIENKKSGLNIGKEAPVWKFSDNNMEHQEQQEPVNHGNVKFRFPKESTPIIRQSSNTQKFRQQKRMNEKQRQEQFYNQQVQKPKQQKFNKIHSQKQIRPQQSSNIIEEIKNNMARQIQVMSQRIIQDKKFDQEQDQQLLISQRQSQEQQNDQKRLDKARKQIGQYLSMKNGNSSDFIQVNQTPQTPIVKKTTSKTHGPENTGGEKNTENNSSSNNQNVGYSFSHQYPNHPPSKIASFENDQNNSKITAQQSMSKLKKQTQTNKISLPNIDQVKSERDALQKVEDDFAQSVAVNTKNKFKDENQSIDKNFIKQIQSVAYVDPNTYRQQQNIRVYQKQVKVEPKKQNSKDNQKKPNSLLQQISKTSMSVEGEQDNNSVIISVAQKQGSHDRKKTKQESNEKILNQNENISKVGSCSTPANGSRVQFKKVSSPQPTNKYQEIVKESEQFKKSPNYSGVTAGGQYFSTSSQNGTTYPQPTTINVNITPAYKTSISNNLTNQVTSEIQNTNTQQLTKGSLSSNSIVCPSISGNATAAPISQIVTGRAYGPQGSISNQINNIQTSISSHNYQQNSRERNNSLKNSNHDEARKLKITISPKYNGNQPTKPDFIAPVVGDFKTKMEQSLDTNKQITSTNTNTTTTTTYQTSYQPPSYQNPTYQPPTYTTTTTTPTMAKVSFTSTLNQMPSSSFQQGQGQTLGGNTTTIGPQSSIQGISTKQSISSSGNRFKLDTMFTNVSNVGNMIITQKREIHQQAKQKDKQHALIRIQKYQKIQTMVQPTTTKTKNSISIKNNQSIKSSQQFEFDLDF